MPFLLPMRRPISGLLIVLAVTLAGCMATPAPSSSVSVTSVPGAPTGQMALISSSASSVSPTVAPPPVAPSTPTSLPSATPSATPSPAATPTLDAGAIGARSHVPIVCYHHIRDWVASDTRSDRPYIVPVKRFTAELNYLQKNAWHTISPDQLQAYLTKGTPLPDKPIMLTFDDGDANQWTYAVRELQKHHFTATFFIMTVTLDKPNYLSTDQVKALDRMGMTVGAHTWDHHPVTKYLGNDWQKQIAAPTKQLEEITGHPIKIFAYPYGLWNPEAIPHLKEAGFVAAYQLADKIDPDEPLYTIRRVIANGFWNISQFEEAITSWF